MDGTTFDEGGNYSWVRGLVLIIMFVNFSIFCWVLGISVKFLSVRGLYRDITRD